MSDIIERLRIARDTGNRVILDQSDVIHLMAMIEDKQTLAERVGSFVKSHAFGPFSEEPLR